MKKETDHYNQSQLERKHYQANDEIIRLIADVRKGVKNLNREKLDWGVIGSLNKVREDLKDIVTFLYPY